MDAGLQIAGVTLESVESNRHWVEKLSLPYPLLSDGEREAGKALRVIRRIGIGDWGVEFFRRCTFLIDARGIVSAVWGKVKVRGHATEVLRAGRALGRIT